MNGGSLRKRLTWLSIVVMAAVLIPLGAMSYRRTLKEMDELADGHLAQAARTLGVVVEQRDPMLRTPSPIGTIDLPVPTIEPAVVSVHHRNGEPEVGFQVFDRRMQPILSSANLTAMPPPGDEEGGFCDKVFQGHQWRLYSLRNGSGLLIRIGERYDTRQDITQGLILEHSLPLLIGLPLLGLLLGWAIKQGLRPLDSLTALLAARTPGSRRPIAVERTPRELKPLIDTLNQQLERLEDALERETRFNADVAHELRTPLAATMIYLENAIADTDPNGAREAMHSAQSSLGRLARRIEHILALSRLEAGAASQQRRPLELVGLATDVIEELAPLIADKGVALSLQHDEPSLRLIGHEVALTAMLRNLVENALRYVDADGRVDLLLERHGSDLVIDISDDGPGIPADRREAMFERFQRGTESRQQGYGLGLSLVRRAAQLHDARVSLLDSPYGHGLRVRVSLPSAGPADGSRGRFG